MLIDNLRCGFPRSETELVWRNFVKLIFEQLFMNNFLNFLLITGNYVTDDASA